MTAAGTIVCVAVFGLVGTALVVWALGAEPKRKPQDHPDEDTFFGLSPMMQAAYLRHPANLPRCACGAYCIHYGAVDGRDQVRHWSEVCQPLREVLHR